MWPSTLILWENIIPFMLRAFVRGQVTWSMFLGTSCMFFILKVFLTGTEPTESLVKNTLIVFSLKNQDIGKCTRTRKGDENKHYIPRTQRKL